MAIVYAVCMGLGVGATAVVARRIGEKNPDEAAHAAAQAILIGIGVSILIAIPGIAFAPRLLAALGAEPGVLASGSRFTRVVLGGNIVVVMLFLINAIFRGAGDAAIAMRSLWIASACNMVLGPLFIFGVGPFPRLGVAGAAIGTTIGRGIGVLYQLTQLRRRDGRIVIQLKHWAPDLAMIKKLLGVSGPGMFQMLIGSANWVALIRILATFGSDVLAGYTIAIRIIIFALLPSWGVSNAAATLVGQNLGARQPERAERSVWLAGFYNMLVLGGVGVLFVVAAGPITGIFTHDPAIIPWARQCLRVISIGFIFYAWGMVLSNAFNGAGDTWTPTWLNFICFWVLELPLAWWLSRMPALGPTGVFASVAIAFSIFAAISAWLFRRGTWKRRVV
jgi:putative MATE family efflux protein